MPKSQKKIKVAYVAGLNRSGTTLVGAVLGQLEGFFSVGELNTIWGQYSMGRHCSCGKSLNECEIWSEIVDGYTDAELQQMNYVMQSYNGAQPLLWLMPRRWRREPLTSSTLHKLNDIYDHVQKTTNCEYIVDTSKRLTYGLILKMLDEIDLYVIHVVRNPFDTASSATKPRHGEEPVTGIRKLIRIARVAMVWNIVNPIIEAFLSNRYVRLRYEDFAEAPYASLSSVFQELKIDVSNDSGMNVLRDKNIFLEHFHSVGGNAKFKQGKNIHISARSSINHAPPYHIPLVNMLTMPTRLKYGYTASSDLSKS